MLKLHLLANIFIPQSDKLREEWVATQLQSLKKNTSILDAGAGECSYKKYCNHLKYTSQDFNRYDGKGDKKGIQTGKRDSSKIDIISDIVKMPIESNKFDSVLCVEVFEHLPRPLDALKEISRVTKKGGTLILTAPFASLTHYSPFFFYSGFSINFYKENLPLYNFKIEKTYTYGNYFDFLSFEMIRIPLVFFRKSKIFFLPILIVCSIGLPYYILLRIFSFVMPSSQNLLCFGIGIRAIKYK